MNSPAGTQNPLKRVNALTRFNGFCISGRHFNACGEGEMTSAVHSIKNQYFGINAHLHSFWQGTGKWHRFHNMQITQLLVALKAQLIPMGYTAETEASLQIRRIADRERRRSQPTSPFNATGAATLTVEDFVEVEEDSNHPYYAIAIYERLVNAEAQPVAWIELLSPTNKGRTLDAYTYRAKRTELLRNGLVFVEIDYLHESPPTFERLADYSAQAQTAHPYRIVVLDPRPDFHTGPVFLHEFDVDQAIPTVTIPLIGRDQLAFDFDAAYQKTFTDALYGYDLDYRQLPLNFQRYSQADQGRIAAKMVAVLEAVQHGVDLETGPLRAVEMELSAALAQIERFSHSH